MTGWASPPSTLVQDVRLENGQVQCTSCHDPHTDKAGTNSDVNFMRVTTSGSKICLACHTKADQGQFNEHDLRMPPGLSARQRSADTRLEASASASPASSHSGWAWRSCISCVGGSAVAPPRRPAC